MSRLAALVAAEVNTVSELKALGSKAKAKPAPEPKAKAPKPAAPKKGKAEVVEVEKIVGMRAGPKGVEYRIKWKGGGKDTWEPVDNVMDDDLVDEFEEELQAKTFGSVNIGVGDKVEVRAVDEGGAAWSHEWPERRGHTLAHPHTRTRPRPRAGMEC